MALFAAPGIPRYELGHATSSTSSGQRRGREALRNHAISPSEACLAALVVQIWGHGRRGGGKARKRILRFAGPAVSSKPMVKSVAAEELVKDIVVEKDLMDQLNLVATKGQVGSARAVFEQILAKSHAHRGIVTSQQRKIPVSMLYSTMIKASANAGDVRSAEETAYRAREDDVPLNSKMYGKLLETAAKAGDIVMANKWFKECKAAGIKDDAVHFACMVEAHAKAGELEEAQKWLQRTQKAGVPTESNMFDFLIFAFVSRGKMQEATGIIREMLKAGHEPEVPSFAALAIAAAQDGDDEAAERWMEKARDRKLEWDAEVTTQVAFARLANASSTAERAESWLRRLQDTGVRPSVENFSVVVDAFAKEGQVDKALEMMEEMKAAEVLPSVVTYSSAMYACTKAGKLDQAASMLRNMMQIGLAPDGVAYGTILDAFAKAGQPDDAIQMTEEMKENGVGVEVRHHNSILEAFVKAGKPNDAARWLLQMPQASNLQSKWKRDLAEPDAYSYSTVIGGLASEGHVSSVNALKQAMQTAGIEATPSLHEQVMRGYLAAKKPKDALRWLQDADTSGLSLNATFICCAIDVCLSNGMGDEGLRWLQRMKEVNIPVPEQGSRAVLFHISAVRVCAKAGAVDDGLDWLQKAENLGLNSEQKGKGEGVPLRPAYIALMKAFAGRSMDVLLGVLDSLEEAEGSMDYMARCELIMLLASWGSRQDALKLLTRVRQEGKLSVLLFSRAISACAKARQVDEAIFWFDEMQRAGIKPDTVAWNSIISACARDGRAAEAEMWLGEMEASGMKPDVVSYNIVINICAKSGRPQEAQDWLEQMQEAGVQPDEVSYATTINALTKANMVDEAIDMLVRMEDLGLPRNRTAYAQVVTGLGRAGRAREAAAWLFQMEEAELEPHAAVYNWVIAACHKPSLNPVLAEKVARRLLASGQMPNDFCLGTLEKILGPDRFSEIQVEIPQLKRDAAQVAQERRRQQQGRGRARFREESSRWPSGQSEPRGQGGRKQSRQRFGGRAKGRGKGRGEEKGGILTPP